MKITQIHELEETYEVMPIVGSIQFTRESYERMGTAERLNHSSFTIDHKQGIDYHWKKIQLFRRNTEETTTGMVGIPYTDEPPVFYTQTFGVPIITPPEIHSIVLGVFTEFSKEYLEKLVAGKWAHGAYHHTKLWLPEDVEKTAPQQVLAFADLVHRKLLDREVFKHIPETEKLHEELLNKLYKSAYITTWNAYRYWQELFESQVKEMPQENHAELLFYSLYVPVLRRCHENKYFLPLKEHVEQGMRYPIFKQGNRWQLPQTHKDQ